MIKLTTSKAFRRKAVLIAGHDIHSDSPTAGTARDMKAWLDYLMSPVGGNWLRLEIMDTAGGSLSEVRRALDWARGADFSLVCFSGHGRLEEDADGNSTTWMMLHDGVEISEDDLNTGTGRCMAVMDCCRGRDEDEEPEKEASQESLGIGRLHDTRRMFETALRKCESGFVRVYATGEGAAAGDRRSFTRELIKVAKAGVEKAPDGVLNIRDAVRMTGTIRYGSRLDEQQTPAYEGGRRLGHFPFAVRAIPLDE